MKLSPRNPFMGLLPFAWLLVLAGCKDAGFPFPKGELNPYKLIQPVVLYEETVPIDLSSFFENPERIDSIQIFPPTPFQYDPLSHRLEVQREDCRIGLSEVRLFHPKGHTSFLLKRLPPDEFLAEMAGPLVSFREKSEQQFYFQLEGVADEIWIYWDNHRIESHYIQQNGDELVLQLPADIPWSGRNHLRVFVMNAERIGNDLLLPFEEGQLIETTEDLNRTDYASMILYFLMVDRFRNGDLTNDVKNTEDDLAPRANFHGGDLAGVLEQLKAGYFDDLGVTGIWLSPIIRNTPNAFHEYPAPHRRYSAYHGYWPISLTRIDARFGDEELLRELIGTLHERDMRLLLDFVSNHVHQEAPMIQAHPDWKTDLMLADGRKNLRLWDEERLTTWFDEFLPSLDYSQKEVIDYVSDSALYWIEEFDIDGFRHDATKHIPNGFWLALSKKINQLNRERSDEVYQIGETFGDRELIGSYVGSDKMDGQFDFNLYWIAREVFAIDSVPFTKLVPSIRSSLAHYGHQHRMGNITGNHDLPRFMSLASGDLGFNEEPGPAGWERDIEVSDTLAYRKMAMLAAFTLTMPGVPIIYYGDEIGMPGAGDPDNRRPMKFGDLNRHEEQLRAIFKELIHLRKSEMSLLYGNWKLEEVSSERLVYSRSYSGNPIFIYFNKSSVSQDFSISLAAFPASYHVVGEGRLDPDRGLVTVAPWSFAILSAK